MSTTLIPPGIPVTPLERERQRLEALKVANDVRLARAALLRRMYECPPLESLRMAAEITADPPEVLAGVSVYGLLKRVRRIGPRASLAVAALAGVDSAVTLGDLSSEERAALVEVLSVRCRGVR